MPNPTSVRSAISVALSLALLWIAVGVSFSVAHAAPVRFADAVVAFVQGPNEDVSSGEAPPPELSDPAAALGSPDGGVVSLGAAGSITVAFAEPLQNLPGPDLVVFENPLFVPGFGSFAELGFVEVSSNGVDFARFPARSDVTDPVEPFGLVDPALLDGLAGVLPTGDVFDLADLAGVSAVTSGLVDLDAIRYVRIVDIVGDGSTLDDRGMPIFDPYPTSGSSGFDLDAVGTVPEPGSGILLGAALLGARALLAARALRRARRGRIRSGPVRRRRTARARCSRSAA